MRARIVAVVAAAMLLAFALIAPHIRRLVIRAATTYDAIPGEPAPLPIGQGPGLAPAPRVRVVLIDGLSADTASTMPAWSALCKRGVSLKIDVGFPTISLPVEVALWTGLTQQQTGIVFRSDRPLVPPLDQRGIPAQVPGSIAIAESHGYIVRSLGFASASPPADPAHPARDAPVHLKPSVVEKLVVPPDKDELEWSDLWRMRALGDVARDGRLVFVHVLEVDDAGHHFGHDSAEYATAAQNADRTLEQLVAAAPDARWFVLSDHGHLPGGGHGGEERTVRQVAGCIAGPGVEPARGELVHIVDVARAIADSVGAKLDLASRGRPLSVALAAPLSTNQAVPPLAITAGAIAIAILVLGAAASSWGVRRWLFAPWWFAIACGSLYLLRGEPTLSMQMVYAPLGQTMFVTWLPALAVVFAATWYGLGHTTLARIVTAQLALPVAAAASAMVACGGWRVLIGEHVAPVVPRFTAYASPLLLIAAHGCAAVALAVLGRTARSAFGRPSRAETPRTGPAAG